MDLFEESREREPTPLTFGLLQGSPCPFPSQKESTSTGIVSLERKGRVDFSGKAFQESGTGWMNWKEAIAAFELRNKDTVRYECDYSRAIILTDGERKIQMNNRIPCPCIFTGKGGYDDENKRANETFVVGRRYTIVGGELDRSSTTLLISGFQVNGTPVMFEFDWDKAPLTRMYFIPGDDPLV